MWGDLGMNLNEFRVIWSELVMINEISRGEGGLAEMRGISFIRKNEYKCVFCIFVPPPPMGMGGGILFKR